MEIEHMTSDLSKKTFQVARITCPYCERSIQYILSDDDISYKMESEFLRKKLKEAYEESSRITHAKLILGKHEFMLVCDESVPKGTLILKNPETGTEMGRIVCIKEKKDG